MLIIRAIIVLSCMVCVARASVEEILDKLEKKLEGETGDEVAKWDFAIEWLDEQTKVKVKDYYYVEDARKLGEQFKDLKDLQDDRYCDMDSYETMLDILSFLDLDNLNQGGAIMNSVRYFFGKHLENCASIYMSRLTSRNVDIVNSNPVKLVIALSDQSYLCGEYKPKETINDEWRYECLRNVKTFSPQKYSRTLLELLVDLAKNTELAIPYTSLKSQSKDATKRHFETILNYNLRMQCNSFVREVSNPMTLIELESRISKRKLPEAFVKPYPKIEAIFKQCILLLNADLREVANEVTEFAFKTY